MLVAVVKEVLFVGDGDIGDGSGENDGGRILRMMADG